MAKQQPKKKEQQPQVRAGLSQEQANILAKDATVMAQISDNEENTLFLPDGAKHVMYKYIALIQKKLMNNGYRLVGGKEGVVGGFLAIKINAPVAGDDKKKKIVKSDKLLKY